jgi:hypothetical protein
MQSNLAHMQLNVQPSNLGFYKDLLTFLGWKIIYQDSGSFGIADTNGTSLWFLSDVKNVNNDYDGPGLNHLGIGVTAQSDVDAAAKYINERGVQHLFETPRHRPDFSGDGPNTYYQVMFETPDRILLEIVYTGPKDA